MRARSVAEADRAATIVRDVMENVHPLDVPLKVDVGIGTNWFNVPGSALTNVVHIPVDRANGTVFYRLVYP